MVCVSLYSVQMYLAWCLLVIRNRFLQSVCVLKQHTPIIGKSCVSWYVCETRLKKHHSTGRYRFTRVGKLHQCFQLIDILFKCVLKKHKTIIETNASSWYVSKMKLRNKDFHSWMLRKYADAPRLWELEYPMVKSKLFLQGEQPDGQQTKYFINCLRFKSQSNRVWKCDTCVTTACGISVQRPTVSTSEPCTCPSKTSWRGSCCIFYLACTWNNMLSCTILCQKDNLLHQLGHFPVNSRWPC